MGCFLLIAALVIQLLRQHTKTFSRALRCLPAAEGCARIFQTLREERRAAAAAFKRIEHLAFVRSAPERFEVYLERGELARRLAGAVEKVQRSLVEHARASGRSWAEIGTALGISKQSAWERFSQPPPE